MSLPLNLSASKLGPQQRARDLKRAQTELEEAKHLDPQQYEHLQGLVRYAGVQLAVKRRRR